LQSADLRKWPLLLGAVALEETAPVTGAQDRHALAGEEAAQVLDVEPGGDSRPVVRKAAQQHRPLVPEMRCELSVGEVVANLDLRAAPTRGAAKHLALLLLHHHLVCRHRLCLRLIRL